MRKLKLQVQLSLDGYMCGPNGELDWMTWNWDDQLNKYVQDLTEPVDHILLGRNLAEGFISHWQNAAQQDSADLYTKRLAKMPKTVYSKKLKPSGEEVNSWENTIIEKGDLKRTVNSLKQNQGEDIIAYGGVQFVSNLIENRLIDEYHFFYNPVVITMGKSIFKDLSSPLKLNLINSRRFDCGIVVNTYTNEG